MIALVVAFLGSLSNDLMVRGYLFAHLRGRLPMRWIVVISSLVYTVDDSIWYEGWEITDVAFSFLLGLALALTVAKTGSIWMSAGIHTGLNTVYWALNGMSDTNPHVGVFISEVVSNGGWNDVVGICMSSLLLVVILLGSELKFNKAS